MMSAALLLGAHARIFASGWLVRTWRIASTRTTVLPVPGLAGNRGPDGRKTVRKWTQPERLLWTYGPNTTKGTAPGPSSAIAVTASH